MRPGVRLVRLALSAAVAAALGIGGCDGKPGNVDPSTPASADAAVGGAEPPTVELFAPGAISTELPEFGTSFSPSGDTVYFNRTSPDRSRIDLLFAVRAGGDWGLAEPVAELAGVWAVDPFVSADGHALYFSSDAPREGAPSGSLNLWRMRRSASGWESPVPLPAPVNSDSSDIFNSVAFDGTMVFSSDRSGTRRIWITGSLGDGWAEPVALTFGATTEASNPALSPDGDLMILAIAAPEGPPDLHVSCRGPEGWSDPVRLSPPVNSTFAEFAPGFSDTHLYFTSERPGVVAAVPDSVRPPGDLYRTPREGVEGLCDPVRGGRR